MKKFSKLAFAISALTLTGGAAVSGGLLLSESQKVGTVIQAEEPVFSGGTGTSTDPYKIANEKDLAKMAELISLPIEELTPTSEAKQYAAAYYQLTNDIDLSGKMWTPIGGAGNYFTGHFDGQGYAITGSVILSASLTSKELPYIGLFGMVQDAEISDLVIKAAFQVEDSTSLEDVSNFSGTLVGSASGNTKFAAVYDYSTFMPNYNVPTVGIITDGMWVDEGGDPQIGDYHTKVYLGGDLEKNPTLFTVGLIMKSDGSDGELKDSIVGQVITFDLDGGDLYNQNALAAKSVVDEEGNVTHSATYKLTYSTQDSTFTKPVEAASFGTEFPGTNYTVKRQGYAFKGWYAGETKIEDLQASDISGNQANYQAIKDNDYRVTARWEKVEYTFNVYDGEVAQQDKKIDTASKVYGMSADWKEVLSELGAYGKDAEPKKYLTRLHYNKDGSDIDIYNVSISFDGGKMTVTDKHNGNSGESQEISNPEDWSGYIPDFIYGDGENKGQFMDLGDQSFTANVFTTWQNEMVGAKIKITDSIAAYDIKQALTYGDDQVIDSSLAVPEDSLNGYYEIPFSVEGGREVRYYLTLPKNYTAEVSFNETQKIEPEQGQGTYEGYSLYKFTDGFKANTDFIQVELKKEERRFELVYNKDHFEDFGLWCRKMEETGAPDFQTMGYKIVEDSGKTYLVDSADFGAEGLNQDVLLLKVKEGYEFKGVNSTGIKTYTGKEKYFEEFGLNFSSDEPHLTTPEEAGESWQQIMQDYDGYSAIFLILRSVDPGAKLEIVTAAKEFNFDVEVTVDGDYTSADGKTKPTLKLANNSGDSTTVDLNTAELSSSIMAGDGQITFTESEANPYYIIDKVEYKLKDGGEYATVSDTSDRAGSQAQSGTFQTEVGAFEGGKGDYSIKVTLKKREYSLQVSFDGEAQNGSFKQLLDKDGAAYAGSSITVKVNENTSSSTIKEAVTHKFFIDDQLTFSLDLSAVTDYYKLVGWYLRDGAQIFEAVTSDSAITISADNVAEFNGKEIVASVVSQTKELTFVGGSVYNKTGEGAYENKSNSDEASDAYATLNSAASDVKLSVLFGATEANLPTFANGNHYKVVGFMMNQKTHDFLSESILTLLKGESYEIVIDEKATDNNIYVIVEALDVNIKFAKAGKDSSSPAGVFANEFSTVTEGEFAVKTYKLGASFTLPDQAAAFSSVTVGYKLAGWTIYIGESQKVAKIEMGASFDLSTFRGVNFASANITIYPIFEAIEYTVKFYDVESFTSEDANSDKLVGTSKIKITDSELYLPDEALSRGETVTWKLTSGDALSGSDSEIPTLIASASGTDIVLVVNSRVEKYINTSLFPNDGYGGGCSINSNVYGQKISEIKGSYVDLRKITHPFYDIAGYAAGYGDYVDLKYYLFDWSGTDGLVTKGDVTGDFNKYSYNNNDIYYLINGSYDDVVFNETYFKENRTVTLKSLSGGGTISVNESEIEGLARRGLVVNYKDADYIITNISRDGLFDEDDVFFFPVWKNSTNIKYETGFDKESMGTYRYNEYEMHYDNSYATDVKYDGTKLKSLSTNLTGETTYYNFSIGIINNGVTVDDLYDQSITLTIYKDGTEIGVTDDGRTFLSGADYKALFIKTYAYLSFYLKVDKESAGTYKVKLEYTPNGELMDKNTKLVIGGTDEDVFTINAIKTYLIVEQKEGTAVESTYNAIRRYMDLAAPYLALHPELDSEGIFTNGKAEQSISEIFTALGVNSENYDPKTWAEDGDEINAFIYLGFKSIAALRQINPYFNKLYEDSVMDLVPRFPEDDDSFYRYLYPMLLIDLSMGNDGFGGDEVILNLIASFVMKENSLELKDLTDGKKLTTFKNAFNKKYKTYFAEKSFENYFDSDIDTKITYNGSLTISSPLSGNQDFVESSEEATKVGNLMIQDGIKTGKVYNGTFGFACMIAAMQGVVVTQEQCTDNFTNPVVLKIINALITDMLKNSGVKVNPVAKIDLSKAEIAFDDYGITISPFSTIDYYDKDGGKIDLTPLVESDSLEGALSISIDALVDNLNTAVMSEMYLFGGLTEAAVPNDTLEQLKTYQEYKQLHEGNFEVKDLALLFNANVPNEYLNGETKFNYATNVENVTLTELYFGNLTEEDGKKVIKNPIKVSEAPIGDYREVYWLVDIPAETVTNITEASFIKATLEGEDEEKYFVRYLGSYVDVDSIIVLPYAYLVEGQTKVLTLDETAFVLGAGTEESKVLNITYSDLGIDGIDHIVITVKTKGNDTTSEYKVDDGSLSVESIVVYENDSDYYKLVIDEDTFGYKFAEDGHGGKYADEQNVDPNKVYFYLDGKVKFVQSDNTISSTITAQAYKNSTDYTAVESDSAEGINLSIKNVQLVKGEDVRAAVISENRIYFVDDDGTETFVGEINAGVVKVVNGEIKLKSYDIETGNHEDYTFIGVNASNDISTVEGVLQTFDGSASGTITYESGMSENDTKYALFTKARAVKVLCNESAAESIDDNHTMWVYVPANAENIEIKSKVEEYFHSQSCNKNKIISQFTVKSGDGLEIQDNVKLKSSAATTATIYASWKINEMSGDLLTTVNEKTVAASEAGTELKAKDFVTNITGWEAQELESKFDFTWEKKLDGSGNGVISSDGKTLTIKSTDDAGTYTVKVAFHKEGNPEFTSVPEDKSSTTFDVTITVEAKVFSIGGVEGNSGLTYKGQNNDFKSGIKLKVTVEDGVEKESVEHDRTISNTAGVTYTIYNNEDLQEQHLVTKITDAGTYYVKVELNDKYYTYDEETSDDVVTYEDGKYYVFSVNVSPFSYEIKATDMKSGDDYKLWKYVGYKDPELKLILSPIESEEIEVNFERVDSTEDVKVHALKLKETGVITQEYGVNYTLTLAADAVNSFEIKALPEGENFGFKITEDFGMTYDGSTIESIEIEWDEETSTYIIIAKVGGDKKFSAKVELYHVKDGRYEKVEALSESMFSGVTISVGETIKDAKTYQMTIKGGLFVSGNNDDLSGSSTANFTINPKTISITEIKKQWNGKTEFSYDSRKDTAQLTSATITTLVDGDEILLTGTLDKSDVGSATLSSISLGNNNYKLSEETLEVQIIKNTTWKFRISNADNTITIIYGAEGSKFESEVNDTSITLYILKQLGAVIEYSEGDESWKTADASWITGGTFTLSGLDGNLSSAKYLNANESGYTISVSELVSNYFEISDPSSIKLIVNKKDVSVTVSNADKMYDGTKAVKDGATLERTIIEGDVVELTAEYESESVGTHNLKINATGDDAANYTFTTQNTATISARNITVTIKFSNETFVGEDQGKADDTLVISLTESTDFDTELTYLNAKTVKGYTNTGWFKTSSKDGGEKIDNKEALKEYILETAQSGSTTCDIYGTWTIQKYTVTLKVADENGTERPERGTFTAQVKGKEGQSSTSEPINDVEYWSVIEVTPKANATYTFAGYKVGEQGELAQSLDDKNITGETTIYICFRYINVTVKIEDANAAKTGFKTVTKEAASWATVTSQTALNYLGQLSLTGYKDPKYKAQSDGSDYFDERKSMSDVLTSYASSTEDITVTIYVDWTAISYKVKLHSNVQEGDTTLELTVKYNQTIEEAIADEVANHGAQETYNTILAAYENHRIAFWTTVSEWAQGQGYAEYQLNVINNLKNVDTEEPVELYAHWVDKEFNLTISFDKSADNKESTKYEFESSNTPSGENPYKLDAAKCPYVITVTTSTGYEIKVTPDSSDEITYSVAGNKITITHISKDTSITITVVAKKNTVTINTTHGELDKEKMQEADYEVDGDNGSYTVKFAETNKDFTIYFKAADGYKGFSYTTTGLTSSFSGSIIEGSGDTLTILGSMINQDFTVSLAGIAQSYDVTVDKAGTEDAIISVTSAGQETFKATTDAELVVIISYKFGYTISVSTGNEKIVASLTGQVNADKSSNPNSVTYRITGFTEAFILTVTATPIEYNITAQGQGPSNSIVGNQSVTSDKDKIDYESVVTVVVDATTSNNMAFVSWNIKKSDGSLQEISRERNEALFSEEVLIESLGAKVTAKFNVNALANYCFDELGLLKSDSKIEIVAIFTDKKYDVTIGIENEDETDTTLRGTVAWSYGEQSGSITTASQVLRTIPHATQITLTASAQAGYEFVGWFEDDRQISSSDQYYTVDTSGKLVITVIKEDINVVAKFKASQSTFDIDAKLFINDAEQSAPSSDYAKIEVGTWSGSEFSAQGESSTTKTITFTTGKDVYIRVTVNAGYKFNSIFARGNAVSFTETSRSENGDTQIVFRAYDLNAATIYGKQVVRIDALVNDITFSFVNANAESRATVSVGRIIVDSTTANVSVINNPDRSVTVNAVTGYEIDVTANLALDTMLSVSETENLKDNFEIVVGEGQSQEEQEAAEKIQITEISSGAKPSNSDGFSEYIKFKLSGYTHNTKISIKITAAEYKVALYDGGIRINGTTAIEHVSVGSEIKLDEQNAAAVKSYIDSKTNIIGQSLEFTGFYATQRPISTASAIIVSEGDGFSTGIWNNTRYIWNAATNEYVINKDAYDEESQEFRIYAAWNLPRTSITLSSTPSGLTDSENEEFPTITVDDVVSGNTNGNSWLGSDNYLDIMYNNTFSIVPVEIEGYEFKGYEVKYGSDNNNLESEIITSAKEYNNGINVAFLEIKAIYAPIISVSVDGGGKATITQNASTISTTKDKVSISLTATQNYTLTAELDPGYSFVGWFKEGESEAISQDLNFEVVGNETVQFASASYIAKFSGDSINVDIKGSNDESLGKITKYYLIARGTQERTIVSATPFKANVGDTVELLVWLKSVNGKRIGVKFNPETVEDTKRRENISLADEQISCKIYSYTILGTDVVNNNLVITPTFTEETVNVTVNVTVGGNSDALMAGTVTAEGLVDNEININYGETLTLTITPNKNYMIKSIIINKRSFMGENYFNKETNVLTIPSSIIATYASNNALKIEIDFAMNLWIENYATSLQGDGTSSNPYKISSAEDLAYMAYRINELGDDEFAKAYFSVTNEISLLNRFWTPIGTQEHPFTGTFNFNGYKIFGIDLVPGYDENATSFGGVFGVTRGANIVENNNAVLIIIISVCAGVVLILIILLLILLLRRRRKKQIEELANN